MKQRRRYGLVILFLIILYGGAASAQPPAARPTGELRVTILGLKSSRGDVIFALYNSRRSFTHDAYRTVFIPIVDRRCQWDAKGLPAGDYAVVVVHDRNGNHDMDSNFLGMPKEPYAFSNNARALFGAPSFEAARLHVGTGLTAIQIRLK